MLKFLSLLSLLVFLNNTTNAAPNDVPAYLESIAVKIKVNDGGGSGVAFTRKDWTGTNNITFIWTASHLFSRTDDAFSMIYFGQTGTNAPVVDQATIIQNIYDQNGEVCDSTNRLAKIIKFSDDDTGQDLALLQLDGPFFNTNSAIFDLTDKPRRIGTKLISVASPYGFTDTYSEGNVSMVGGAIMNSNVFDQTSCVIYPGSSGGGVFDSNGIYVGMSTIMKAANLNFMIPIRRIHNWAKQQHLEWALDPKIPMPSEKEYKAIKMVNTDPPSANTGFREEEIQ